MSIIEREGYCACLMGMCGVRCRYTGAALAEFDRGWEMAEAEVMGVV